MKPFHSKKQKGTAMCFEIPIDVSSMGISSLDEQFYAPF